MNAELTLMGIVSVIAALASGAALFVSMKVSGALSKFKNELLVELDERYVRLHEFSQMEQMKKELEQVYRQTTKGQIEGLEVEVKRDKDDITIALKGLLTAINAFREDSPRRGGRS